MQVCWKFRVKIRQAVIGALDCTGEGARAHCQQMLGLSAACWDSCVATDLSKENKKYQKAKNRIRKKNKEKQKNN